MLHQLYQPPALVPQRPPLPSNAVEYWHGELGASAANAVGQIAAVTLPGVGTPSVTTAAGFFRNRTIYRTTFSGTRYWGNRALPTVLATGTRPWLYAIGRFRTPANNNHIMFAIGRNGSQSYYRLQTLTGPAVGVDVNNGAVVIAGPADIGTGVHRFKVWSDGTNANLTVDNTNYTAAHTGSLPNNVDAVCMGSAAHTGAAEGDCDLAFWLLCSSKPTPAEEAALDVWARGYWGTP